MYSNITAMHSTKCSDGKTMLYNISVILESSGLNVFIRS